MARIGLTNIGKRYANKGDNFAARGVSYTAEDEESVSLLGPSGCGRSTTLNMITDLESISKGTIKIGGVSIETPEPRKHDLAFVFQDYVLYPHPLAYENIVFGARMRRVPKAEIVARVREATKQLGLIEQLRKYPEVLPGGQRQRVVLACTIARCPGVLLYDEPLSNLNALLRDRTRAELELLHNEIGAANIYVTHDQEEAMSLSHKIAVVSRGRPEQYGSPEEIYSHPAAEFVAGFVGKSRMNLPTAEPLERGLVAVPGTSLKVDLELPEPREKIRIGPRPSEYHVVSTSEKAATGKVVVMGPLGVYSDVIVDIGDGELFITHESGFPEIRVSDHVTINLRNVVCHAFDIETDLRRG